MANAVYRRIFDDVSTMTSAKKWIRRDVFAIYSGKYVRCFIVEPRRDGVIELELELTQTQMAQKPMLRAEVGMRVRCANKASAE